MADDAGKRWMDGVLPVLCSMITGLGLLGLSLLAAWRGESPESDPDYSEKILAGILFVAGVIGIIIFVIRSERRIRHFDPKQKRDNTRQNGKDR